MEVKFTPGFEKSLRRLIWQKRLEPINPFHYGRQVKYFVQRGRRGYSDPDLWNANDTIARVTLAFLDHNAECKAAGYPMGLTEEKWEEYKGEIRWLMEQELERFDTPVEVKLTDAYRDRMKRANRLFGRYWMALWD